MALMMRFDFCVRLVQAEILGGDMEKLRECVVEQQIRQTARIREIVEEHLDLADQEAALEEMGYHDYSACVEFFGGLDPLKNCPFAVIEPQYWLSSDKQSFGLTFWGFRTRETKKDVVRKMAREFVLAFQKIGVEGCVEEYSVDPKDFFSLKEIYEYARVTGYKLSSDKPFWDLDPKLLDLYEDADGEKSD